MVASYQTLIEVQIYQFPLVKSREVPLRHHRKSEDQHTPAVRNGRTVSGNFQPDWCDGVGFARRGSVICCAIARCGRVRAEGVQCGCGTRCEVLPQAHAGEGQGGFRG